MICTERHSNVVFTGFVEKSKYRKMMSNIGQYRKIGSTKGVQKNPYGSTKSMIEKSKYRKMMSNIGQYRKIGSTKGVQKNPYGSTKSMI